MDLSDEEDEDGLDPPLLWILPKLENDADECRGRWVRIQLSVDGGDESGHCCCSVGAQQEDDEARCHGEGEARWRCNAVGRGLVGVGGGDGGRSIGERWRQ